VPIGREKLANGKGYVMYLVKLQQALSLAGLHVPTAIDVHELLPIWDGNPAFLLPPPCAWFEILWMYCPRFDFE
jgi:hypothetical protein